MIDILVRGCVGLLTGALVTFLLVFAWCCVASSFSNYKEGYFSKLELISGVIVAILLLCCAALLALSVLANFIEA